LLYAIKPYPVVQTIHDYGAVCPVAYNIHKDNRPCPTGLRKKCFWQHQVKYSLLVYLVLTFSFFTRRRLQKKTVKKFFAPSPLLVDYLKKNQFHNATYIAPFKRENCAYSFDKTNPHHFLFAGNLGTHKGVHMLIEEFALAAQRNHQLTLTIAGTGQEERRLRRRTKELGLENNIFFTGWQNDLNNDYEKCAAVIFPSLWMEAFGLVITEAMSHARPVIGSNRGSPVWLIDDQQTGFIFDPLKKGDLAEKLLKIAGNLKLIKTLGQRGYNKLQGPMRNDEVLQQIICHYQAAQRTQHHDRL
jgi:glycosyltransferase involved in cell wall biosynthesis